MIGIGQKITKRLQTVHPSVFAIFAVAMAFTTYFCMYAFRKPFAAASYQGEMVFGLGLKDAAIISQLVGYALSKFIGIKFNSEMKPGQRAFALIGLILFAELALVLFAVLPNEGKVLAIFLNGLPLGAVWGVVFSFLEGRQISEILGAGLSCSYIIASGWVKSAGSWLVDSHGVAEVWMPALTGLLFLPLFLVTVWGLSLLPPPSEDDVAARTDRSPMYKNERRAFVKKYFFGLALLVLVYLFLTAFREFGDSYEKEIFVELGVTDSTAFGELSMYVAFVVMGVLSLLFLVKSNRLGLLLTYIIMGTGAAMIGVGTILFDMGVLTGFQWKLAVALGLYLAYVPFGCVLFDRMIAALGVVATAVFLIYVADAVGYGGSVGVVIYKRLGQGDVSVVEFFRYFSYITSVATFVGFFVSGAYFMRRAKAD